jgi:hypothetical protein
MAILLYMPFGAARFTLASTLITYESCPAIEDIIEEM